MAGIREVIVPLVDELRRLDLRQRVLGAAVQGEWGHGYHFHARLSAESVAAFERRHGVELPADYRAFVTEVGDGGAGPHYGVQPLASATEDSDLSQPFPWASDQMLTDEALDAWEFQPGVLILAEQGCGYRDFMIVNGDAPSRIWSDYTAADGPLTPCHESFTAWYVSWATRCIATIQREPLLEKVRLGMTVNELRDILGDGMQRWDASADLIDAPAYYVGFENTSASFSIGPDDCVTAVHKMGQI